MSVPALNAKTLRMVRWVQVAGLILSIINLARGAVRGEAAIVIISVALVLAWSLMLGVQTKLIRRREELDRPRPDYSAIAAMEREVYGEAFKHDGAPAVARPVRMVTGQTAMCKRCMMPYARINGFCSRCYRTHKEAARS